MKKINTLLSFLLFGAISITAQNIEWGDETKMDTLSYASGVNVAYGMNQQFGYTPFDYEILEKAVSNSALGIATLEEDSTTLTKEQIPGILNDYFGEKYPDRLKAGKASLDSLKVYDEKNYLMSRMFETQIERTLVSKAFGMNLGASINKSAMPVKVYWVLQGMRDMREGKAIMSNAEAMNCINYYMNVTRVENLKKQSSEWIASVAQMKGVKVLPSGLLYKIDKKGNSKQMPLTNETEVTVHYKGSKADGTVFDATRFTDMPPARQEEMKRYNPNGYDKNDPISFALNRVIAGWTEGLKLIGKGGKITLWIPYNLAYGERGAGGVIAPYEALRFDIELIDVKNK